MEYINGVYIKRKEGKYGEYFVISFKEEGIAALKALPSNSDGFRVVIASPQKADKDKFSVKPFVKREDAPF